MPPSVKYFIDLSFIVQPMGLKGFSNFKHILFSISVYNDDEDALYVHHDILLPSFPMTLEWLNYDPGEARKGNLVAVGSMAPIIDVWDVDIIDSIEPAFSLGQKKSKKRNIPRIGHKDAVLSLSWNHNVR